MLLFLKRVGDMATDCNHISLCVGCRGKRVIREAGMYRMDCFLACFTFHFTGLLGAIQLLDAEISGLCTSEQMAEGQYRVMQQHPRAGKTHYFFDPIPHFRPVTMHPAILAGGLIPTEGAFIQALIPISL